MASRGNTAHTVRLDPYLDSELTRLASVSKKSKAEIIRESIEQHLVGESWLAKCDDVLKASIHQLNDSNNALEARIRKLVDEGAIDFEIQTINKEISASEERLRQEMQSFFESKFKTGFENMLRVLPTIIIQLHENQKATNNQGRES